MTSILDVLALDDPVQQSRAARLLLAYLEGDPVLSLAVFSEISADPRGESLALSAIVATLVEALVRNWTRELAPADVAVEIRRQLAALNGEVPRG